ncbi:MAG: M12 family metallo-peptidase [Marinicella pacifica]
MNKYILFAMMLLGSSQVLCAELLRDVVPVDAAQLKHTEMNALVAAVNVDVLTRRSPQFALMLPDGQNMTVLFKDLKRNHLQGYSWQGHRKGDDSQAVTISVYQDAIAGSIQTDKAVYEIQPLGDYQIKLVELNSRSFPECDGAVPASQASVNNPPQSLPAVVSRATHTVDVIVVYTPEARVGAGGHNAIKATAQAAVDAMNSSLVNSLVDTEIVLLYAGEVNYNDSGDSSADLNWLRYSAEVETLKNLYGADMTALLVESMGGCGRGYVMRNPGAGFRDWAVQVTRRSCAVGNLSFAHEFGHNMGLEHNPENSSATSTTASYAWSFGHYHSGQYRTVMSYSNPCTGGCTRRQYFSNPDVNYLGLPTGIDGERDNARTLDLTSPISAAFRVRTPDVIFMNGFE